MNKRGTVERDAYVIIVWAIAILLILGVLLTSFFAPNYAERLPDALSKTVSVLDKIFGPVVQAVYYFVAPVGQDDNVQMIAFAIFLLLTFVGNKALKPFLGGAFLSGFVSVVIGIIAARSLTATVLENSALSASPIAAASLVLGFIPVYAIVKNLGKWEITHFSKLIVYAVVGAVYAFIFGFVFKANILGIVYGVGIFLLGISELVAPYYREAKEKSKAEKLGTYMAGVHKDIETAGEMAKGAKKAKKADVSQLWAD